MLKFSRFIKRLDEGGNVKVKTADGETVGAKPVFVHDRKAIQHDIHHTVAAIHDSFHRETGHHLFGPKKEALHRLSAYSGSTRHLMDNSISDDEFKKHKKSTGDVDVAVPKEHGAALHKHLAPGKKFGAYSVVGTDKRGAETSAIMRHEKTGETHQFDFENVEYHGHEPGAHEQFGHGSSWEDTKHGIKGAHHKMLLNAIGGEKYKFSPTYGLRSRTDPDDPGIKHPTAIHKQLFGDHATHENVHSFVGLVNSLSKYGSTQQHQQVYDKFKTRLQKNIDHSHALAWMKHHLNVKDTEHVHEAFEKINKMAEKEVHHTTVIPMVGFSPISHMGHAADLGSAMHALPGTKHLGISEKADAFSPEERKSILARQWSGHKGKTNVHTVKSAGETVEKAFDSLPKTGKKVLHLLVGHDRADFANKLKDSLLNKKLKRMEGKDFDEIHVHHPEDTDRSHGMSGTKMREAAFKSDLPTFQKHLGPMFHRQESEQIMKKVQHHIASGSIKLKRSG